MTRKRKRWLIASGMVVLLGFIALFTAASTFVKRLEPYIREQAIRYLEDRFESDVELAALRVHLPYASPVRLFLSRGRGAIARVEGEGLMMRHRSRRDIPPMFVMQKVIFNVDIGTIFDNPKVIPQVQLEGMEINIPPKGERPKLGDMERMQEKADTSPDSGVIIQEVIVTNSRLSILPRDAKKVPLRFDLHRVRLESAGVGVAMKYDAALTNAKPPGEILSQGTFGPWAAGEPGDTPLSGVYTFEDADLGVFSGIAGILQSSGSFEGALDAIRVHGKASVPEFRLKMSGKPVPLTTTFEVLVDGTNGNTVLQPVVGVLGSTHFTTSGGVIKHEGEQRRTISLDVLMPRGNLEDVLGLAMKGPPFMAGHLFLKTKIDIPPLTGKVREKLLLRGQFEVSQGRFLRSSIQDQIDTLSRRGQGRPKSPEIDEVIHAMGGAFDLANEVITFRSLSFAVPGAVVDIAGSYNLDQDILDFRGALKLQAKVSQTMTGWKRWVLKPIDPFFSKQGAGTFLRIKVEGTAEQPRFGLD